MSSVVIKYIDKERVRSAVDAFASRTLAARPEVEEIVVFGSFEEDTYAPGSDVDIFLLLSHSSKSSREGISDYLAGAFPVGMDLLPHTTEEMAALVPSPMLEAVRRSRWRYRR